MSSTAMRTTVRAERHGERLVLTRDGHAIAELNREDAKELFYDLLDHLMPTDPSTLTGGH